MRFLQAGRATTRVAPPFQAGQAKYVGATLVVALKNFSKISGMLFVIRGRCFTVDFRWVRQACLDISGKKNEV
jgi:hypothetical protein